MVLDNKPVDPASAIALGLVAGVTVDCLDGLAVVVRRAGQRKRVDHADDGLPAAKDAFSCRFLGQKDGSVHGVAFCLTKSPSQILLEVGILSWKSCPMRKHPLPVPANSSPDPQIQFPVPSN